MTDLLAAAQALRATLDATKAASRHAITAPLMADELDDATIVAVTALFDPWATDSAYSVGDIVAHDGVLYRCVQAHSSQDGWTPDKVPALWTPVREKAGAAPDEWVQPAGASDAYSKGDRVTFQGQVWESTIDTNVWSPSAYPAGWKRV